MVRLRLPGIDSTDELGHRLAAHVETCLACQAEAAKYRTLRRRMGALADEIQAAPQELVPAVVERIAVPDEAADGTSVARRAAIAVSAAAGAMAAAGAGTIIVIGLRRSHTTV
jgi:anti-sigma factor RsiW